MHVWCHSRWGIVILNSRERKGGGKEGSLVVPKEEGTIDADKALSSWSDDVVGHVAR